MPSQSSTKTGNRHKQHRSSVNRPEYGEQRIRTERNKLRRARITERHATRNALKPKKPSASYLRRQTRRHAPVFIPAES